jgi:hypothetical protein
VFSFGSAEKGQLGNGTTGERITTGNKTAFDIEPSPGESIFTLANCPLSDPLIQSLSIHQGTGRKAHRANRVGAAT